VIILDTNIISEFMTSRPNNAVLNWLNNHIRPSLFISTISIAEIGYGLRNMPEGTRRRLLTDKFSQFVDFAFEDRVLAFGEKAAKRYPEIMGRRREAGRPMSSLDGQIASIAQAKRFTVATRNTKDFEDCGVMLVNPFNSTIQD